jgi:hypothetical protein
LYGKGRQWEGRGGRSGALNVFKEKCLMSLVEGLEFRQEMKMMFNKKCTDHVNRVRNKVIVIVLPRGGVAMS